MKSMLEPWILEAYLEPCETSMMEIHYLKRPRSCNRSRKQFTLLNYTVYLIPDEILEPFVEPNGDLSMENDVNSKHINLTA